MGGDPDAITYTEIETKTYGYTTKGNLLMDGYVKKGFWCIKQM